MSDIATQTVRTFKEMLSTIVELRNDSDYWEKACMHLLYCVKPVAECEKCQSIQKKLEQP